MGTKLKSYSHSLLAKIIAFIIVIICFSGSITTFIKLVESHNSDLSIMYEQSYYESNAYKSESDNIIGILTTLISKYKSKEFILKGETIEEYRFQREKENLFVRYQEDHQYNENSNNEENYKVSREEIYKKFEEEYADKIEQIKEHLIQDDLNEYNFLIQGLQKYRGVIYYAGSKDSSFTNSNNKEESYFKSFPSYMIFTQRKEEMYPEKIENNNYYWNNLSDSSLYNKEPVVYIGFTEEYLNPRIEQWEKNKEIFTESAYRIGAFLLGLILSFMYLVFIIGRKFYKDEEVHLNGIDKLYNDINIIGCILVILLWFGAMNIIFTENLLQFIAPITAVLSIVGLLLVLSLIKHIKNKSIIKHTLLFTIFHKSYRFLMEVYNNGSVAVKVMVIIIGYPALVALTFFMFPITIGVAAWLALKKVKEFNSIKEGVEKIKNGDINHTIDIENNGEFGRLATNINGITDGLNKAIENELKSERLKTELITNVSHDIRTPLTSIITYVDLLKREEDQSKAKEYIEILDQKSQRLKSLTEDLFDAAKASSGNIPVNYEKIDVMSLITQGLGELDDKIEESKLKFIINQPKEKVYVKADGKLLWRTIENLLSNIFKYALKGSRVYLDIEDIENEVSIIIKNISAYELNLPPEELMDRFKRGDESRSSQGSGLGLSIAKSLIENQRGSFNIDIDGDLFKAIIKMPKFRD